MEEEVNIMIKLARQSSFLNITAAPHVSHAISQTN